MDATPLWHWAFFWTGLTAQVPYLWFLARLSFYSSPSKVAYWPKLKFGLAIAGAFACCAFAAYEQDQLLFWGQAAALASYIKLAQHHKRNEQKN